MSKKVLITGVAGFIGSHLAEKMLKDGWSVFGLDNFDEFYLKQDKLKNLECINAVSDSFTFIEGSINNNELLLEKFSDVDLVIHLAAKAGVRPSIDDPVGYNKTNVDGTMSILEFMRSAGIKKHILASSSSVYGNNKKVPFSEKDNVDFPISPYAATKKTCELICHTYSHLFAIDTACLRFFTVYGPRQRPDLAIHKFSRLISAGEPISMYGDGTTKRDYTYIDDIIDGISKTVKWIMPDNDSTKYEVFNLGESCTVSLKEMISALENALGKKAVIEQHPMQPGDVSITYADISKAKSILGYDPKTQIADGLNSFVKWFNNK